MTVHRRRERMALGAVAPAFDLPATDGQQFSITSFSSDALLVVLFLANHCSHVTACEEHLVSLALEHAGRGASFVAINASDVRLHHDDSPTAMERRVHEAHYPFPYLYDSEGEVARAFGATCIPEAYVFDHARRLRYHGAVRSTATPEHAVHSYLQEALRALRANKTPAIAETEPAGCPIDISARG